jgi:hypothetical protein
MELVSLIDMVDLVPPTHTHSKEIAIMKIDVELKVIEKEDKELLKSIKLMPVLVPKLNVIIRDYERLYEKSRDDFNESEKALIMKEFGERYLSKYEGEI